MTAQQNIENRPKPFSKERTKETLCKVIWFYSVFFVVMKIMAIFQGAALLPHSLIGLPFLGYALWGFKIERTKTYNWAYVLVGIVLISAIRYYEVELIQIISNRFE